MNYHTHLEDNFGGDDKFRAWKFKISPILEDNYLDQYINGEVPKPEVIHKKNLVKDNRIIAY